MSVLKKIQFAPTPPSGVASWMAARMIGIADWAIIGAGTMECQKPICVMSDFRDSPCSIAAR
jgi:hypothetical protein